MHRSRQELSGVLIAEVEGRSLFRGKFNISSLATRRTLVSHLKEATEGYTGWTGVVEQFCERVDELDEEGPAIIRLADLAPPPQASYRLDPLIPRGFATLLYGPGGAMKSTLAAGIAVSVATGVDLFDLDAASGPGADPRLGERAGRVGPPAHLHRLRSRCGLADRHPLPGLRVVAGRHGGGLVRARP